MAKSKSAEPEREPIKLIESMRDLFIVRNSEDFPLAFLTVSKGADESDARSFAQQHITGAANIRNVAELLYEELATDKWQRLMANRVSSTLQGSEKQRAMAAVHRDLLNEFSSRSIGGQRFVVEPRTAEKRRAYSEQQEREREAAMARTKAGVADGTTPELAKLLKQRDELDDKIAKVRETERLKRDAKYAKQRAAQKPQYVAASGLQGGLPG